MSLLSPKLLNPKRYLQEEYKREDKAHDYFWSSFLIYYWKIFVLMRLKKCGSVCSKDEMTFPSLCAESSILAGFYCSCECKSLVSIQLCSFDLPESDGACKEVMKDDSARRAAVAYCRNFLLSVFIESKHSNIFNQHELKM